MCVCACVIWDVLFVCLVGFYWGFPLKFSDGHGSPSSWGVLVSVNVQAASFLLQHRVQPLCVSGGTGDLKMPVGLVLTEFIPVTIVILRDASQADHRSGTKLSVFMHSLSYHLGGRYD